MDDYSHAVQGNALLQHAKEKIGEIQTSISAITHELEQQVGSVSTFQERGSEIVGMIVAAGQGSQQYHYQIDDAAQTTHYVTNDMATSCIAHLQETLATLNQMHGMLARAHEGLGEVVF